MKHACAHQWPDVLRNKLPLLTLAQVIERMQERHSGLQHVPGVHHLVDEWRKRWPGLLGVPAAPDFGDACVLGDPEVGHAYEDAHLVHKAGGARLEWHGGPCKVHLQAIPLGDLLRTALAVGGQVVRVRWLDCQQHIVMACLRQQRSRLDTTAE